MKLAFILVVLVCFLVDNPTEAVVPELPGDLARLQTYLQNQEALLQQVQNDVAGNKQGLDSLKLDLQSQSDMNRQELDNVMRQLHDIRNLVQKLADVINAVHGK
ncbi:uncharacterized protein LOC144665495 [Oculina patagonica]